MVKFGQQSKIGIRVVHLCTRAGRRQNLRVLGLRSRDSLQLEPRVRPDAGLRAANRIFSPQWVPGRRLNLPVSEQRQALV